MSALLANKTARRKGATWAAFLVASLVLLTVSSNAFVRDIQHGVAFAFRPVQVAIDGIAHDLSSIATTIAEIDRIGVGGLILVFRIGPMPAEVTNNSIRLFMEKVAPQFRRKPIASRS